MSDDERCACGQPLHYINTETEAYVRAVIAELGPDILVRHLPTGRAYLVPRHYIALHGLKGAELPTLGFPEAPFEEPRP